MARQQCSGETVSEIHVNPQPSGLRAVYLVETGSVAGTCEVERMFSDLETHLQVRQLSRGQLISYVVQAHESDSEVLDEIDNILRANYGFVVTQRSFDELIYRIVQELCNDTGSELIEVPQCDICAKIEPFPNTVVELSDVNGVVVAARNYCGHCTAQSVAPSNKEFIRSLLAADRQDFSNLESAELVRHRSRKQPIRFKIKSEPGNEFAESI